MRLIFVHGWSVTDTGTYGKLPQYLHAAAEQAGLDLDIQHIFLGKYISFHDEVTLDDISRAMNQALEELSGNGPGNISTFSCVTHSTGGPVVRSWIDRFYGVEGLNRLPLQHLVMLAPANHGSPLAKLGKARVGRLRAWFSGVEPGQRVLDWLCLGSDGQWQLNLAYMEYDIAKNGFFPFVLVGQDADVQFYDYINRYLVEEGSDGVVRVSTANLNYRYFPLEQDTKSPIGVDGRTFALRAKGPVRTPQKTPLGVYSHYSHTGDSTGIMQCIGEKGANVAVVEGILKCLQVQSHTDYQQRSDEMQAMTSQEQKQEDCYCNLVFNIRDDQGERISKDNYDLILLGDDYMPNQLPQGFFQDRQMNDQTGRLVYYLNASKMHRIKKFGIRVIARPDKGFSYYCAGEFQSDGIAIQDILQPNQTTYIDIVLHRFVDENVFRFGPVKDKPDDFKKINPSGKAIQS